VPGLAAGSCLGVLAATHPDSLPEASIVAIAAASSLVGAGLSSFLIPRDIALGAVFCTLVSAGCTTVQAARAALGRMKRSVDEECAVFMEHGDGPSGRGPSMEGVPRIVDDSDSSWLDRDAERALTSREMLDRGVDDQPPAYFGLYSWFFGVQW